MKDVRKTLATLIKQCETLIEAQRRELLKLEHTFLQLKNKRAHYVKELDETLRTSNFTCLYLLPDTTSLFKNKLEKEIHLLDKKLASLTLQIKRQKERLITSFKTLKQYETIDEKEKKSTEHLLQKKEQDLLDELFTNKR